MKRHWLFIALLLLLGIASYATTRAIRESAPPAAGSLKCFEMLQNYLDLTPQQRKLISEIDTQYAGKRVVLRDNVLQAREELRQILRDPDSTSSQAVAAAERLSDAQQKLQINTLEYTYELRQHLTPAQRQKLMDMMDRGMCALTGGPAPSCGMGKGACGMGGMGGRRGSRM